MSADTATAEIRPFLFDTDFDIDIARAKKKAEDDAMVAEALEEAEEEEFKEEIVPTFSESELEQARKDAYEQGRKEGTDETLSSIQNETFNVIKALSHHITELFSAQEKANNVLLRDGIGISTTITRKLFPEMNRQNALNEIRRLIETTLLRLIEEPRIIVRIHPDMQAPLSEVLPDLKAGAGYEGRLLLKEDQKLPYGDCRLEWGDGSAERAADFLWQSIDQIIEENTGIMDSPSSETGNTDNAVRVETGVTRPDGDAADGPTADAESAIVPDDSGSQQDTKPDGPSQGVPDGAADGTTA